MSDENLYIKFFDRIQDNAYLRTKKGLLFVELFIFWFFFTLLKLFPNQVYNCIFSLLLCGAYLFYWYYFSGRLFFSPKIKILFAIDSNQESKDYTKKIIQSIKSQLDGLQLTELIDFIQMPSDFIISERVRAERYIKTKMVDLLIWGHTLDGRLQETNVSEFKLNFTYLYRILPEQVRRIFVKQIDDNLKGKYWRIIDDRSFNDIKVISSNITEVSLFIIGLCLFVRGNLDKCSDVFERLIFLLKEKTENDFPDINNIKNQINLSLIDSYGLLGQQLRNKDPKQARIYFKSCLKLNRLI